VTTQSEQRPVTLPVRTDTLATLIQSRRSVRKYQNRPVLHEFIEPILEAARWAPSPHGRQPWRFAVLTAQKIKLRLANEMGTTWQQNLQMDGQNAEIVNIRLEKSRQRILNAPVIIIPCLYLEDLDYYPDERRQADEKNYGSPEHWGSDPKHVVDGLRLRTRRWLDVCPSLLS